MLRLGHAAHQGSDRGERLGLRWPGFKGKAGGNDETDVALVLTFQVPLGAACEVSETIGSRPG